MATTDVGLFRTIERKVEKEGLEPAKIDIIVVHGHVTLTGVLMKRITHQTLNGPEIENFKKELTRIDGVTEVNFHLSGASSFV